MIKYNLQNKGSPSFSFGQIKKLNNNEDMPEKILASHYLEHLEMCNLCRQLGHKLLNCFLCKQKISL